MDPNLELATALAALVRQIDISDYRDSKGHPAKTNLAFIHAQALVDRHGVTHAQICEALDWCAGDPARAASALSVGLAGGAARQ